MWLIHGALRHPFTILVLAISIVFGAALAVRQAPADIFPSLGVPVIYVVQPYAGMSPTQMEGQFVYFYEYHFLYVTGIEHIESKSIQGMAMIKLTFHRDTDIAQAMAQVTAQVFRATAFMPPGTLPAFVIRYDAGSVPIGQVVFSSASRGQAEIEDLALNRVRPLLATLPGASAPPPTGGLIRTIVAYLDPDRLRAYRIAPDEVAAAIARANLTLPAGNVRVGDVTTIATTNAMVPRVADLADVPIRRGAGPTVYVRDVARVEDAADIVYNVALVDGRHTVYMPVTKRADASTLDVVGALHGALPRMRALVPPDVHVALEFDQSIYVKNAIRGLGTEGILGAGLTALVILLFLRNWRAALIVTVTIPLSIMAASVALRLTGNTINIMTLSGLALAVGILVDEATVAIENIHTHLSRGKNAGQAVIDAMREVMLPRLLAMFCILAVFLPSFFMRGISRSLFPPLALAVGFAMIASFFISTTLVPVLSVYFFRKRAEAGHAFGGEHEPFARARRAYGRIAERLVKRPWLVFAVYLLVCAPALLIVRRVGTELFPRVDAGQFQLRIRAPGGTRIERTVDIVREVDRMIRHEVGERVVKITLANVGSPPWEHPVNAMYTFNAGPQEAVLLVALEREGRPPLPVIEERLRRRLAKRFPNVRFSFEAGDIVSQVLNFGAPAPIQVTVSANDLSDARHFAERVLAKLERAPMLRDVQIPLALDYPTLDVRIDRDRAGQYAVGVESVVRSVVAATSSSVLTTRTFWIDPSNGLPYFVAVQVPEAQMASAGDLLNLQVTHEGQERPVLSDVADVTAGTTPGEIDRYDSQRTVSVTANVAGDDLAAAAAVVERAIRDAGQPPRGSIVTMRGQVQQMRVTLTSLQQGLALAIVVVLLMLAANFQSVREPLIVLTPTPAVLGGVVVALWMTRSSVNVQSMMGAVMSIGVSVANSVLLVTFARDRWRAGDAQPVASVSAAEARLRPILMTSLAMVFGMIPTALGMSEGGEQTAPLGRAVIGGLIASTVATLVFLPSIYVLVARKGAAHSPSLDPTDPDLARYANPSADVPTEAGSESAGGTTGKGSP